MNGLKLLCCFHDISFNTLANKMNINRANISMWMNMRGIPEQRIPELQKIFPNVPRNFFTRTFSKEEKDLLLKMLIDSK